MKRVFLILSIGTMLAVASCTKEKAVTATNTNTETDEYGVPVRKYWPLNGIWDGPRNSVSNCKNLIGHPNCYNPANISTRIAKDLYEVVLFGSSAAIGKHFSVYEADYLKGGLENIFTNGLIKGDLNISVMGYTSDSMRLYRVYNKDSTFDYGIPIQEIK